MGAILVLGGSKVKARRASGVHWSFDKTEGIAQGRRVADLVVDSLFLPVE